MSDVMIIGKIVIPVKRDNYPLRILWKIFFRRESKFVSFCNVTNERYVSPLTLSNCFL